MGIPASDASQKCFAVERRSRKNTGRIAGSAQFLKHGNAFKKESNDGTKDFFSSPIIFTALAFTAIPAAAAQAPDLTYLVKDINMNTNIAGASSRIGGTFKSKMVAVNGMVYLIADDGNHGEEIWKSDGTAAGTVMVKDINPAYWSADFLYNANGTFYFQGNDLVHGLGAVDE